ncbi:MAG TPA: tRNA (guanine(37)-N(1))-methyltransferase [Terracidiphilus sp.]|jgi:tRNA (guanine37-N1)-methyltransferase|nr:tRNA (guanine(37)-N(1))-methyltransferase [Terracidiphilus sp.]
MRFDIVTIFPGFFAGFFEHGIVRRAQAEGLVSIAVHDLRNFTQDRHRTVDDRPFGGGEGMVLKPEPLARALESLGIGPKAERSGDVGSSFPTLATEKSREDGARSFGVGEDGDAGDPTLATEKSREHGARALPSLGIEPKSSAPPDEALCQGTTSVVPQAADNSSQGFSPCAPSPAAPRTRVVLLSAQGRPFTQALARDLAKLERVILICGRYEGVDERINELFCDMELSIGDYVLSGGELAAAVVVDAAMRLIPGVLGNEASGEFESFGAADAAIPTGEEGVPRSQHGAGGLLDYPHYTRPAEFHGLRAPEVLLNGDHQQIRRWRREQQLRKTMRNRPDLLQGAALSEEDRRILEAIRKQAQG